MRQNNVFKHLLGKEEWYRNFHSRRLQFSQISENTSNSTDRVTNRSANSCTNKVTNKSSATGNTYHKNDYEAKKTDTKTVAETYSYSDLEGYTSIPLVGIKGPKHTTGIVLRL